MDRDTVEKNTGRSKTKTSEERGSCLQCGASRSLEDRELWLVFKTARHSVPADGRGAHLCADGWGVDRIAPLFSGAVRTQGQGDTMFCGSLEVLFHAGVPP